MGSCCGTDNLQDGQTPNNLFKFEEHQQEQHSDKTPGEDQIVKQNSGQEGEKQEMEDLSRMIEEDEITSNQDNKQRQPVQFQYLNVNESSRNQDLNAPQIRTLPKIGQDDDKEIQKQLSQTHLKIIENENIKQREVERIKAIEIIKENEMVKEIEKVKEDEQIIENQYKSKEQLVIEKQIMEEEQRIQRMKVYEDNTEYIVRIQAYYRGQQSRNEATQLKEQKKIYLTEKQKMNAPSSKAAKPYEQKVVINIVLQKYLEEYGTFEKNKKECLKNIRVQKILEQEKEIVQMLPYIFINHNGIYIGQWKKGFRHGFGKFIVENQIYEGFWEENYASGYGRTIFANGDMYEGEYFNDQAQGNGIYITKEKTKYQGQFANNKPHGYGKESWNDGSRFIGTFSMGKKQGEGTFHFRDGSIYQGNFNNNLFNGQGTYTWPDGRNYVGTWANNLMDGEGQYTWADGRSYTGSYIKGKKEGSGLFKWPKGQIYQGQWKFGHQHGIGYYTNEQKEKKKGKWKFGKFIMWVQ